MRKVIAAEYLSLDGVTEDPGPTGEFQHRGWTMPLFPLSQLVRETSALPGVIDDHLFHSLGARIVLI